MFKFFRKIRRDLIAEGKIKKYFKYAIGEIVLVVAGILIAFQLNNLKNESDRNDSELQFYRELRADLLKNKAEIEEQLVWDWGEVRIPLADSLDSYLSKDSVDVALINYIIGNQAMAYRTFNNANSSYNYMANEGYNFIRNESIRINTTTLYETNFRNIDFNLKLYEEIVNDDLKPLLFKYGLLNAAHQYELIDVDGLRNDLDFRNHLNNYRHHLSRNFAVFSGALAKVEELIREIDDVLEEQGVEIPSDADQLDPLIMESVIGKYAYGEGDYLFVFEDDNRLFYHESFPFLKRQQLFQVEGQKFEMDSFTFDFKSNDEGRVIEVVLASKNDDREFILNKVGLDH
ncbi:DUF6090 family protein [Sanyastnella coralliicola]|uniref:DUF6090 family protein n=1 Tax=Sanyastnella coralliicola TaxID=3069118 RepID=UPI0027B9C82E|nr:DUF6090 family protein [Longitalea sp. SCSIO 12813]